MLTDNEDGTLTNPLLGTGNDALYHFPVTPAYIWNINYAPDTDIERVVFEVDVVVDEDATLPIGYAKKLFWIQLYNLETVAPDSIYGPPVTRDSDEILRTFLDGEDLARYVTYEEDADGVRHYRVEIPYNQFDGGKPNLVFQPLPGTTFANPKVTVLASNGAVADDVLAAIGTKTSTPVNHASLYDNWTRDWAAYPDGYPALQDKMLRPDKAMMPPLYNAVFAQGGPYMMPAAEFGLEGEYVFAPEGLLQAISINQFWYFQSHENFDPNAQVDFMRTNMINPDTGLVYGVWDYSSGTLIETDRVYSNLSIVSAFELEGTAGTKLSSKNRAFLMDLLLKAIDQEIVEAPNGELIFAPGGIEGDVANIRVQDLEWGIAVLHTHIMLEQQGYPESANRLLEAYANTLQLLVEAQENTPSNLLPSQVNVVFTSGGGYFFEYPADPVFGEAVFDASSSSTFLLNLAIGYESFADESNNMMDGSFLSDPGYIDWIRTLSPQSKQDAAWAKMEAKARNFDNTYRIQFAMYQILYNTYRAVDGNYARYYSLETGQPLYPDRDPALPQQMAELNAKYGSIGTLMNWMVIARFFHDQPKIAEIFELVSRAAQVVECNMPIDEVKQILPASQRGFSVFSTDGYILTRTLIFPDFSLNTVGGNIAPWGQNGTLAWRETIDELLQRLYEYGVEQETPTPVSP